MPEKIREIIAEHRFSSELQSIIKDARRALEFVEGTEWVLARHPNAGTQMGGTKVWFLPMEQSGPNMMQVVIYYTFDEDHVNLMSITETVNRVQK